ncbi:hypothetical protein HED60_04360 [Planctomycetales bacterium ZRK34]|nr:hypothetical protein HED60_04360 [Planctomycetales bacterium ZRK34]
MAWIFGILFLAAAAGLSIAYLQWRQEDPEKAARIERFVGKTGKTVGRVATNATKRAAVASVQAVNSASKALAEQREAAQKARIPLRWVGCEESVEIDGFTISQPLTYLANRSSGRVDEPSSMDPRDPVSRKPGYQTQRLPYWPSYHNMDPTQRFVYLSWMSEGRIRLPSEIGYAFVFFYGLERRTLVDQHDHETAIAEVLRLRQLHRGGEQYSGSFENYTAGFLWFLSVAYPEAFTEEMIQSLAEGGRYWNEDKLASLLCWFATQKRPLSEWAAFIVAGQLPQSQRSVVTNRVGNEFKELFCKYYRERYHQGLTLESSARDRAYRYTTASAVIGQVCCTGTNPMGRSSQLKSLSTIWNQCVDELRKFSSVVQKQGDSELTPEAWEAMPEELRNGTDHPLTQQFCRIVDDHTTEEGFALIPVHKLAPLVGAEHRDRLTPTQSRQLCVTAEHIGYGLEPDARIAVSSYKREDVVAPFLRMYDEQVNPGRYKAALCMLRLGLAVAASDGEIHPDELAVIAQNVEKWFQLNAEERRRLESMQAVLIHDGPDMKGLQKLATGLKSQQKQAIGKMLIALIAADGIITKEEIRSVRKCYRTLGMSESDVDAALSTLESLKSDEPVTVVQAGGSRRAGEAIPTTGQNEIEFHLDRGAIAEIMQQSREVSAILADAMGVEESVDEVTGTAMTMEPELPSQSTTVTDDVESSDAADTEPQGGYDGLPERFHEIYEALIKQDGWCRDELEALGSERGLMIAGAIEAINDWTYETYGGPIFVEDGDRIVVERALLD